MSQSDEQFSGRGLVSRMTAAVLGGYALSSTWVLLCGAFSPSRVEAIVGGMQSSWLWYVAVVIGAFAPVSPRRIWTVLAVLMLLMLAGTAGLIYMGGR